MPKGHTNNPNGRPRGSKNKVTLPLRTMINDFLAQNFEKVVNDFDKLKPTERAKVYVDLLSFGLPKLQAIDGRFQDLPDGELDEIFSTLVIDTHEPGN